MYTICIRREANRRAICYTAFTDAAASPAKQNSFGLSAAAGAMKASSNTECTSDYIEIISAIDQANVLTTTMPLLGSNPATLANRLCGRALNNAGMASAAAKVCSAAVPFRIGVNFDADEVTKIAATPPPPGITEANDERFSDTGGIVGFKLAYTQVN